MSEVTRLRGGTVTARLECEHGYHDGHLMPVPQGIGSCSGGETLVLVVEWKCRVARSWADGPLACENRRDAERLQYHEKCGPRLMEVNDESR